MGVNRTLLRLLLLCDRDDCPAAGEVKFDAAEESSEVRDGVRDETRPEDDEEREENAAPAPAAFVV